MLIQQLRFDGFLSFAPGSEPFELRPLNVLIGPNGSGKSNLIEALGLLAATPHDLAVAVRAGGGAREWLWKGQPKTDSMEIEAVVGGGSTPTGRDLRYRLNLGSVRTRLELLDEAIEEVAPSPGKDDVYFYYRFQRGHPAINIKTVDGGWTERRLRREDLLPDQSVLAQRKDPEQYPEVTWVGRRFSGILVFNEWTFGRHSPPRDPQPADLPDDRVLADSSNLAHILNRIEHAGDTRINGLLKTFFPRFERLTTRVSGGTVQFHLRESGFEAPIPATRLSDGTLRFIALLAALHSPSPPSVLCIEQPELGLHPDAVALLAEVLVEASTRTQLIVTTHSDSLVSALTSHGDSIVTCERIEAGTVLNRVDPDELRNWLADYTLGDLWRMGVMGANP